MSEALGRLDLRQKSGREPFNTGGEPLGIELIAFWRWAASDLTSNAMRGVLAEYLVAHALGADGGVRTEWDACDVCAPDGTRVEVKSAAYIQSWAQKALSTPAFRIAPARGWDATTNVSAEKPHRAADVYVFALLHHRDKATIDPLDVGQWTFYVLPRTILDERCAVQKQIRLAPLLALKPLVADFTSLRSAVAAAGEQSTQSRGERSPNIGGPDLPRTSGLEHGWPPLG